MSLSEGEGSLQTGDKAYKTQNDPKIFCLKIRLWGAGEMAQQLRALSALPEILSSIPSNCTVGHNHL